MARRGKFGTGGSGSTAASDVVKSILSMQSTGETAAPAGTTDGTAKKAPSRTATYALRGAVAAAKPDYSGLDFTGLDKKQVKELKKTQWTPEYTAARKALAARQRELATPYTQEQIQKNPALRALAGGITFEQALGDYRKLVKVMNLTPIVGQERTKKQDRQYKRLVASMTPQQWESQRILGLLGGFGKGNVLSPTTRETTQQTIFRRLGLPVPENRGMVSQSTVRTTEQMGPIIKVANPLSSRQRSRLQRLRSLTSLTPKQKAALVRLRNLKNAPTPYPTGE